MLKSTLLFQTTSLQPGIKFITLHHICQINLASLLVLMKYPTWIMFDPDFRSAPQRRSERRPPFFSIFVPCWILQGIKRVCLQILRTADVAHTSVVMEACAAAVSVLTLQRSREHCSSHGEAFSCVIINLYLTRERWLSVYTLFSTFPRLHAYINNWSTARASAVWSSKSWI